MNFKNLIEQLFKTHKLQLISTHRQLSLPIIIRIYKKMKVNLSFASIQVDGQVIIDGHHWYVASLLANYKLDQVPGLRSKAKKTVEWGSVKLLEEDWDSEAEVNVHDQKDAKFNNMGVDELLEKISKIEII
jgi:uncharacterized lipoprotein